MSAYPYFCTDCGDYRQALTENCRCTMCYGARIVADVAALEIALTALRHIRSLDKKYAPKYARQIAGTALDRLSPLHEDRHASSALSSNQRGGE